MIHLQVVLPLFLLYLMLTTNLEVSNLVVGLLIAVGLSKLLPGSVKSRHWRNMPAAMWAAARYLFILIVDLIGSGIQVARIVLHPQLPIQPGIIAIPVGCESELATALSAHAITLTPGEMVVEIGADGMMYTHVLDAAQAATYMAEAQQMRRDLLNKIFA